HGGIWRYVFGEPAGTIHISNINNTATEPNIYQCPTTYSSYKSAPDAPADFFYSGNATTVPTGYSYGWNPFPAPESAVTRSVHIDSLTTATRTVMVVECYMWHIADGRYELYGIVPHNGTGNFLFFDGHVERLGRSAIPKSTDRTA